MAAVLRCMECGAEYALDDVRYRCDCGGLLDVAHELSSPGVSRELFDGRVGERGPEPWRRSGVWRFRELVLPVDDDLIVSRPEGDTPLYRSPTLSRWVGLGEFVLKHEGENPTGSFKDRGMTVGVTWARALGARAVACASTGNTAASMAAYAALAGLTAVVFVPAGKVALGKLAQALAYGALTLEVEGDFDAAMALVQESCRELGIYLLNSLNPFRIEGQKTIVFEILQDLGWDPPDWIVFPAGNLGNTAAFGKALWELLELGLIPRMPRLAAVQAAGANPLYRSFARGFSPLEPVEAETVATAIRIGNPVSFPRAVRSLRWTGGVVVEVTDQEIMDAKAVVDAAGIGCEPASAAAVAGTRKLVSGGVIGRGERVVAVLTGNLLKDPEATIAYHTGGLPGIVPRFANRPRRVAPSLEAVAEVLEEVGR
ncbi:threonine synthase [Candidatus Bipolaricaulota sp. J31]